MTELELGISIAWLFKLWWNIGGASHTSPRFVGWRRLYFEPFLTGRTHGAEFNPPVWELNGGRRIPHSLLANVCDCIQDFRGISSNLPDEIDYECLRTLRALVTVAVLVGAAFIGVARDIGTAAVAAYKWVQQDFAGAALYAARGFGETQAYLKGVEQFVADLWTPAGPPPAITAATESVVDLADATDRASRNVNRLSESQRDAAQSAQDLAREAAQVYEQTRTPAEQYRAEVERLTRMLDAAAISQDTFNRAMRDAGIARDAADPLSIAGRRIMEEREEAAADAREEAVRLAAQNEEDLRASTYDGIRGGLEAAADGNLGQYLAARLRSALFDGLADSLTNMLRGEKGSSNGGAMGWLNAAGSMLKAFSGGKIPGFKTGGSFKVGGSGGADSQLMQFRATPGEMVDIRRPGQDQGSGGMAVHVVPSPYFDVRVEKLATPIAGRSSMQAFGAARSQVPADAARRARFNLGPA
jgi:hypothetical protein